jgi:hypothetical protein
MNGMIEFSVISLICVIYLFRLWQRYDFHHTGMVSYKDFLSRLGVSVQSRNKPPQEGAMAGNS